MRSWTPPRESCWMSSAGGRQRCAASLKTRGLAHWLENDDRDLATGLLLVVGEARDGCLLLGPDPLPLVAAGHPGSEIERLGPDLGPHRGIGDQVVVPGRMRVGAGLRAEYSEAARYRQVHHRVYPLLAALGAHCVQQQQRRTLERAADPAVLSPELGNDLAVKVVDLRHVALRSQSRRPSG